MSGLFAVAVLHAWMSAQSTRITVSAPTSTARIANCNELIAMPSGEIWTVEKYVAVYFGKPCL